MARPPHAGIGGVHGLVTSSHQELLQFIASSFRSSGVEPPLVLKSDPRTWRQAELVTTMRASDLVVSKALGSLLAAGLASCDETGVRYQPVNEHVADYVVRTEALHASRPDALAAPLSPRPLAAGHAFRLRKEPCFSRRGPPSDQRGLRMAARHLVRAPLLEQRFLRLPRAQQSGAGARPGRLAEQGR